MTLVRALFVFAILILPATSFAVPVPGIPTAGVVVTGVDGPIEFSANGSPNSDGTFTATLDVSLPTLFEIDAQVLFDLDPFVQYSVGGAQNFTTGPLNFTFVFLTPFGGGPYSTLISSHASNVTDGGTAPDGTVVVVPFGGTFIHRPQINGFETAVGQIGDGCTVSGSPSFSAFCDVGGGSFPITPVSGPGTLGVTVAFTLSAGDSYAATGRVELLPGSDVPEPSTLILSLSVLAGILYRQRRR